MQNQALLFKDDIVLKMMRDRYLRDLVTGKESANQNVKEHFEGLQLNPYFVFPAVALLEPAASHTAKREDRDISEQIRDYLEREAFRGNAVFTDIDGRIGILFSWVSKDIVEKIRTMLVEHFAHPVNIGVGKPCGQLADISASYRQAVQALQNKFYRGTGKIIYFSELGQYEQWQDDFSKEEQELFERVKNADGPQDIERAVDAFYEAILRHGQIPVQSIYEITVRLLVSMEKRVLASAGQAIGSKSYEIMSVIRMETLEEIKRYAAGYFTELNDILSQNEKERHRSIIRKTIKYMEQECRDATLNSVAQKVYMTPTYLSLLFKTSTGKTFIEQLTDIRIDKAKDMLKSTHLKNYEVAERVGYQDSRYFSQIFKKKVGVSPSEYREKIGR